MVTPLLQNRARGYRNCKQSQSGIAVSWFVYILKCEDDTLYTGITNNKERRLSQHNKGKASKYTRVRLPVEMIYSESTEDRSSASKREWQIKQLSRKQKLALIAKEAQ